MKRTIAAAFVGLCLYSATATAEPAALVMDGTASARDQKLVLSTATETLTPASWEFRAATFSAKEVKALIGCAASAAAAPCVTAIAKKKNVERVAIYSLGTHLTRDGITETVISARLLVPSENTIVYDERFCAHCTDDTIVRNTRELTQKLLAQLAVNRGRTILDLRSVPSQAGAFLDGESIGATDLKVAFAPGPHTVRVVAPGYRVEERQVVGVEGKTTELIVALESEGSPSKTPPIKTPPIKTPTIAVASPQKDPVITPPRRAQSTLFPKLLIGLGGAAVVSGGVLILLNEKDTFAPKGQEQQRMYYPTLLPGGILLGSGVLAAAIGGYLLMREPKTTTLVVAPAQGGAVVGLIHGF